MLRRLMDNMMMGADRMKRWFMWLVLLALPFAACAETETRTGRVREDMPLLTVTVAEIGAFDESAERQYLLAASVAAEDGSLDQTLCWFSGERPGVDRAAAMVMLRDFNFDGYADLQLLTAQGARNVFYALSLWNPAAERFDPVLTDDGYAQLEMCNPEFRADTQEVLSVVADGYRFRTETLWGWEGGRRPVRHAELQVYDAGEALIGEMLTLSSAGSVPVWDQSYPEDWYHGDDGRVYEERAGAADALTGGAEHGRRMRVAGADWVHLRHLDRKDSPSLARLERGAEVQVLQEGCGEDAGWVMVWVSGDALPEADRPGHALGLTGYIWHSFLADAAK